MMEAILDPCWPRFLTWINSRDLGTPPNIPRLWKRSFEELAPVERSARTRRAILREGSACPNREEADLYDPIGMLRCRRDEDKVRLPPAGDLRSEC